MTRSMDLQVDHSVSRPSRREILAMGLTGTAMLGTLERTTAAQEGGIAMTDKNQRKNVLFIMVDDLRPDLGCYGHPYVRTPNIDQLAAEGTTFTHQYCQVAMCAPSRMSLLSGLRPDTSRVWWIGPHVRDHVPDVVTLPQAFKQAGYHTQGIGKIFHSADLEDAPSWSVPHSQPDTPPYGPDEMPLYLEERERLQRLRDAGVRTDPQTALPLFLTMAGPSWEAPDVPDDYFWDGQVARDVIAVLEQSQSQPFFLCAGFVKPHLPFVAPRKYFDLYPEDSIRLPDFTEWPANALSIEFALVNEWTRYRDIRKPGKLTDRESRDLIRAYYAATSYVDAQIGRITEALKRLGLWESTIVVVWGDNGFKLGEYGYWGKETNFELDTRVPLIVRHPAQEARGVKTGALTESIDLYPTLCDLCGIPTPPHVEGTSMAPLLERPDRAWKPAAFSQFYRMQLMGYSMRTGRYRYTEWVPFNPEDPPHEMGVVAGTELYDHDADPGETVNIAEFPANRQLVQRLSAKLRKGWREARAPHGQGTP